ncbi:hypothetical protein D3C81_391480 [compost metagenome]
MATAQLCLDRCLGIVEYKVVGATGAQFTAAQAGQGALLRQLPWRRIGAVVDRADDDRMVDITVLELHDDFLAHARQGNVPQLLARHRHHDAYPWRTAFVKFTQAVPVKLQPDTPQCIGMDFLPGWTDHQRRLHAGNHTRRAVVAAAGTPADIPAHANELVCIVRGRA